MKHCKWEIYTAETESHGPDSAREGSDLRDLVFFLWLWPEGVLMSVFFFFYRPFLFLLVVVFFSLSISPVFCFSYFHVHCHRLFLLLSRRPDIGDRESRPFTFVSKRGDNGHIASVGRACDGCDEGGMFSLPLVL